MTRAQLIAALLDECAPIIRDYWTDVRHDARLISNAPEGSTFLWSPYKSGTRIILLQRGGKPNERAASIYSAMMAQRDNLTWFYASVGQADECALTPQTNEDACVGAWEATRRAEGAREKVSELHM